MGIWGRLADGVGSDHRDAILTYHRADIAPNAEDKRRDAIPSAFCVITMAITARQAVIQCDVKVSQPECLATADGNLVASSIVDLWHILNGR